MQIDFKGKNVVITGGTTGIGRATVELFLNCGAFVYNIDVQSGKPTEHPDRYQEHLVDISDIMKLSDVSTKILKHANNKIDVLFCNAGIHHFGNIENTDIDEFDKVVGINLKGLFFTLKYILPSMKARKSGSVILMGSDQSHIGKSESAVYGLTKGAIGQLTKSTAIDCANDNVRVNCICPGTIETPLYHKAVGIFAAKNKIATEIIYSALQTSQPIKRVGNAHEVANVVGFLASDLASYVTGSLYSVDGGYCAQ